MIGISNEPLAVIQNFIEDQGITFPVLHDIAGVYSAYNIPGGQSPYPRDYIIDEAGIIQMAKTEYAPGIMIQIIEDLLGASTVSVNLNPPMPDQIKLLPNFPNPFNPATTLLFALPSPDIVRLDVVNLLGHVVATLFANELFTAGIHSVSWDGSDQQGNYLPAGIYLVRLRAGNQVHVQKVLLLQ